jgi:hypothetical protein
MDGHLGIEHDRQALRRILAALVAMAGLGTGNATLPRHLRLAVLRLLRPAEAAARRLIIALARGIAVTPPSHPCQKAGSKPTPLIVRNGVGTGIVLPWNFRAPEPAAAASASRRPPALPLLDPLPKMSRRRWVRQVGIPRIGVPGRTERAAIPARLLPSPDDRVDATRLARRFAALAAALDDLPAQATRFARWQARRAAGAPNETTRGKPRRLWPLRPGRPPGWRRRPFHEVHEVLDHAHQLAVWALRPPDTS